MHQDLNEEAEPDGGAANAGEFPAAKTANVKPVAEAEFDLVRLLYNSNPFYFISALLVLLGVRFSYGEIPVGSLNCWGMLGVLAGYTALMAAAGVVVIRIGKVWDDARSILVTLVLLFVAMSVSFDELLIVAPDQAFGLTLAGWVFAVLVSECVLWLARIRFPACYRFPYLLAISLLFWFPYFSSPELTGFNEEQTQWRLLAFPWLTAAVMLTLLPAVWLGQRSVANNTTPWKWPIFPWSLFVFLGVVCVMRTYVLTFSFGPSKSFETSFGGLHLFPMAIGLAILLLEAGHKHNRRGMKAAAMALPAAAMALLWFESGDHLSATIAKGQFAAHVGDPTVVASLLAMLFYGLAALRTMPLAEIGLMASGYSASAALGGADIVVPLWALCVAGLVYFAVGAWTRSATRMLLATGLLACGWLTQPLISPFDGLRMTLAFHTALFGLMVAGPIRGGRVGEWLLNGVAVLLVSASAFALLGYEPGVMTPHWSLSYIGSMACVSFLYGRILSDERFRTCGKLIAALFVGRVGWSGWQYLVRVAGPRAAVTLVAGTFAFVVAGLISAKKSQHLLGADAEPMDS